MKSHREIRIGLLLLLAIACLWRIPQVREAWPNDFAPVVQLNSAIAARTLWLGQSQRELSEGERAWLRDYPGRFMEVPVLQYLAARVYDIAEGEVPWVTGFFSALFWIAGGLVLWRLAVSLWGPGAGALAALAFHLLCPFGVLLSLSFQPEALLMLCFLLSLGMVLKFPPEQSWKNTWLTSLLCGLAALAKPGTALIPLFTASLAVRWHPNRLLGRPAWNLRTLVFLGLATIPSVIYLLAVLAHKEDAVIPSRSSVQGIVSAYITPATVVAFNHFAEIARRIGRVVGWYPLLASLLFVGFWGTPLLRRLYFGLLVGYFLNMIAFASHHRTHDYYHMLLIPIVALGLGAGAQSIFQAIGWATQDRRVKLVLAGLILTTAWRFPVPATHRLKTPAFPDRDFYTQLGEAVGKGAKTIALTDANSQDARYFAWLRTQSWAQEMYLMARRQGKQVDELEYGLQVMAAQEKASHVVLFLGEPGDVRRELAQRMSHLPVVFSLPNVIVYEVTSWHKKAEPRVAERSG